MHYKVNIVGGGLAGSEAALRLARLGVHVSLVERRPNDKEPVHKTGLCAELVCSNSFKGTKPTSAAGLLKQELAELGSDVYSVALDTKVDAGGALAVDRQAFATRVTQLLDENPFVTRVHADVARVMPDGSLLASDGNCIEGLSDAVILATGPLTSESLSHWLENMTASGSLAFFDAAAPIVMADSINTDIVFKQDRYDQTGQGAYLNAPFTRDEYERFIRELLNARKVIARDFETSDLFQACQPVEEVARTGTDALRFGAMKPVGLIDPRTGKRPWAVLQLRAEDRWASSYNLVGCQTNLTFGEQERVFRLVPGLEQAQFARFGVMHRNTFLDAPRAMDATQRLVTTQTMDAPIYLAGQLTGTEGYTEAIRSGLNCALSVAAYLFDVPACIPPVETAYGSLLSYATDSQTVDYQPKHVNFGDFPPLDPPVRKRDARYAAYAQRATLALEQHRCQLEERGLLGREGA